MKSGAFSFILFAFMNISSANTNFNKNSTDISIIETSHHLLLQAKTHEPTDSFVEVMKNIPQKLLWQQLKNDNDKKAFWINLYNAYTQIILFQRSR